jgi:hypothetical protein
MRIAWRGASWPLPPTEEDPLDIHARARAITVAGVAALERLTMSSAVAATTPAWDYDYYGWGQGWGGGWGGSGPAWGGGWGPAWRVGWGPGWGGGWGPGWRVAAW